MGKADLLPMGSLVYLKGGGMKLMVITRGPVFEDDKGETVYADYLGAPYHGGFQPDEGAATGGPYGTAVGFLVGTAYDSFENSAKNHLNFLGKLAGA